MSSMSERLIPSHRDINAVQTFRIREIKGSPQRVYYGQVQIYKHVFGFMKIRYVWALCCAQRY